MARSARRRAGEAIADAERDSGTHIDILIEAETSKLEPIRMRRLWLLAGTGVASVVAISRVVGLHGQAIRR